MSIIENRLTKIEVGGRKFNIVGEASSEDILRYAEYVNEKIRQLGRTEKDGVSLDFMILTAMNIAEDLFGVVKERDIAEADRREKTRELEELSELWDDAKGNLGLAEQDREEAISRITELTEENRRLAERIEALKGQLAEQKNSAIQMQMFIPEEK